MTAQQRKEAATEEAAPATVTVEYIGSPPYGTEFHTSHTIHKGKATKFTNDGLTADVPRDLVWHKSNGFKLDIPADETELLEALRTQPFLKVHE
jgi:hypothetical protein